MEKLKLEDVVVKFSTGLNPRKNFKLNSGGTFKYITIKNIKNGFLVNLDSCDLIDSIAFEMINKRANLEKNDVLFTSIGATGDTYLIEETPIDWNINESVFTLKPNLDKVTPKFLSYLLSNPSAIKYYQNSQTGSTFKSIKMNQLKSMYVKVYSIEKQKKIVVELDRINKIMETKKTMIEDYNILVDSVFNKMFGERIKSGKKEKLLNLCELITDGTHQTPSYTSNGVIFLSSKDVTTRKINWNNIKYIPEELHNQLKRRVAPQYNDILLAKNGTTGIAAIVDKKIVFDIYVSLALIRVKREINPKFMLYQLNTSFCKKQFDKSLKGIGVPNLHLNKIRETLVINPSLSEQKKFVRFVENIEKQKELIQQDVKDLNSLLEIKMHEYFD